MLIKPKKKKSDRPQLGMNLKFSRLEIVYRIRRFSRNIEKNFMVLPFWRNGYIWMFIISILAITSIITVLIGKNYNQLPPDVLLIYDTVEDQWQSFPKMFLFGIPIVLIVFGIINIQVLQKVYYMNKKMTLMICTILTATYFLSLIAVNEIILLEAS